MEELLWRRSVSESRTTYESVIASARTKLHCGPERISDTPGAYRWNWWATGPDLHDELLSNYAIGTCFAAIEKEFREEIETIRETLDELTPEPELADSPDSVNGAERRMMKSLDRAAQALRIWDEISVPIRRRGDIVFRIWSPRDVMGSPIIKALPIDAFVHGVVEQTAKDQVDIERLRASMGNWRLVAIVLVVLASAGLVVWLF